MKKSLSHLLGLAFGLSLLLAACSSGSELLVINNSAAEFCELHLSPSTDPNWGPDQLEGDPIASGDTHTVRNIAPGLYDVRLVPCHPDTFEGYERYKLDLSQSVELTVTDEEP